MRRLWLFLLLGLGGLAALGVAGHVRGAEPADALTQKPAVPVDPGAFGVRILLGVTDTAATPWNGSIQITDGAVRQLDGWRFRGTDRINGLSWQVISRARQVRAARRQQGVMPPIQPVGILATLSGGPQSRVHVTTQHGSFDFAPAEIRPPQPATFLQGAAVVESVFPDFHLTSAATEDDYPAAAVGKDGIVWTVYVGYRYGQPNLPQTPKRLQKEPSDFNFLKPSGNGDQVRLARLAPEGNTAAWTEVAALTPPGEDVYRPAVAAARDGTVWIVWSQNVGGNWDLYARRWREGALSNPFRITIDPGPDLHAALAADERGGFWLAWQAFREGTARIFTSSLAPGSERWSPPGPISFSGRDDWDPQVVCGRDGSVWAAWDTYDRGNYDVMLRRIGPGRPGEIIPVAQTPLFEARPSLAIDGKNRLWVAWEEAPAKWGKDYGYVVRDNPPGIGLYLEHHVALRCYVDGRPFAVPPLPSGAAGGAGPGGGAGGLRGRGGARRGGARGGAGRQGPAGQGEPIAGPPRALQESFPRLGSDGQGRICLTFRRPVLAAQSPTGTAWYSFVTVFNGTGWTRIVMVADSDGTLDNRPALVAAPEPGTVYLIHSSDARDRTPSPKYEIYVSPLAIGRFPVFAAEPQLTSVSPEAAPAADPEAQGEAGDLARIRAYRIDAGGHNYRLVRGDFHRHTEISMDGGGDGPLIDLYRYALDAAGMDWMCAQDHDNGGGREYTWWEIQKLCDAFHTGDRFFPLFGYERSVAFPDGHRNVMFVQRGIRPLPRLAGNDPAGVSPNDTKMLYHYLHAFGGISAPHTSATNQGTDWRDNDTSVEPVVEIYQGDRQSYEYEGAPRSGKQGDSPSGFRPAGFVWNALAKGYRIGFQASSDHRSNHMAYAVALVDRPVREAVLDAFKKRHTYGATDNIILDVRCETYVMGDEFQTSRPPELRIRATGTGPIARIVVVKDNKVVYTATPNQPHADVSWLDGAPKKGKSYYYVRVEQADGQLAWGSPMWITYQGR